MLNFGFKHSEETKRKMSLTRKGRKREPFSEEWRRNIGLAQLGRKRSEEAKRKTSRALLGKKKSMEHRKNIGLAHKGEKCHFWKGGVSPINHIIRQSLQYKLWRKAVFERDNYQCIQCGLPGGWNKLLKKRIVLNADHIKQFALYPELHFVVDNGRTLCEECHWKTDTYGVNIRYIK